MGGLAPTILAAILVGGYLLGSIPFGLIAARLGGAFDFNLLPSEKYPTFRPAHAGYRTACANSGPTSVPSR